MVDEDIDTFLGHSSGAAISPSEIGYRTVYMKITFTDEDIINAASGFGLSEFVIDSYDSVYKNRKTGEYELEFTVCGQEPISKRAAAYE